MRFIVRLANPAPRDVGCPLAIALPAPTATSVARGGVAANGATLMSFADQLRQMRCRGYARRLAGRDPDRRTRRRRRGAFDALMQRRPYKPPWSAAAAEIVTNAGTQFDPSVVASFEAHEPAALVDPLRSAPT
jgi:hypothetical protein